MVCISSFCATFLAIASLTAGTGAAQEMPPPPPPPAARTTGPAVAAAAPLCGGENVGAMMQGAGANTFRRFAGEPEPMFRFYSDLLGFEALGGLDVGDGQQVWRFATTSSSSSANGGSQIKVTIQEEGRTYVGGGVRAATGLRLWTFFYDAADEGEQALIRRFVDAGFEEPVFEKVTEMVEDCVNVTKRSALVVDPSGQDVELVIVAGHVPPDGIEVGMVVSDMAASVAFYRGFMGLEDLGKGYDGRFETPTHTFRFNSTTIKLRSFGGGRDLPADTGSAGVQYIISNVTKALDLVECYGVSIERPVEPVSGPSGTSVALWVEDPDGITNYFYEALP